MELIIFLSAILFWIVYYIFEGLHDSAFIKERDVIKEKVNDGNYKTIEARVKYYEKLWHKYDNFEKSLVKIVFSIFVFIITNNLLFSFQLLCLAVAIRMIMHDLVVAVGLGKGIHHIGPSEDILWDSFLRKMKTLGINQYVIKIIPLAFILFWIIYSL